MNGYMGKILRVDLSTDRTYEIPITNFPLSDYIGGKGLGAFILFQEVKPETDALDSDNVLAFLTGPLNGLCPSTKMCVVSKSPLTGTFDDSYVGGHIASELKYAGYDGVIIKGRRQAPSYLHISDTKVEILDAADFWGLDTFATEVTLLKRYPGAYVACIGPAGEKMVRFAHINTELYRQAGRGGLGAVMGSKNLKAIVFKGSGAIKTSRPEDYTSFFGDQVRNLLNSEAIYQRRRWGTARVTLVASDQDLLPTRNFNEGTFQEAENIGAEAMEKSFWVKDKACSTCPINCGKIGVIRTGPYSGTVIEGVEFESAALLGSNCGVSSLEDVVHANDICDRMGLDTISAGNVIGFIMECFERGILEEKELGKLEPKFGNSEAIFELLEMIARREGFGNLLAEGVKRASEKIGKGSEDFAIHVKGLEIAGWGIRASPGMALSYATSDRGGCHKRAWPISFELSGKGLHGETIDRFSTEGRAAIVKHQQDFNAATDCLVACDFAKSPIGLQGYVKMLNLVVGSSISTEELLNVGERTWNLVRLFNVREGFDRKQDTIPWRMRNEQLPSGLAKGHFISDNMLEKMIKEYYVLRGWDDDGIPLPETLERLAIRRERL